MQKLLCTLAVVATLALLAVFGVRQYGNSRVANAELNTVTEAVQEAVAERKEALDVDVRQATQSAKARDSVRLAITQARKQDAQIQAGADCPSDADRLRVLNDAISKANADVQRARELPR